jgi:hypothetical protein
MELISGEKRFLERSEHRAMTQESAGGMPLDLAA